MKANTVVWVGLNHAGKADQPLEVKELKALDAAKEIARFMLSQSMATRFDFVVARTESEVRARFNTSRKVGFQAIEDELDKMFSAEDFE